MGRNALRDGDVISGALLAALGAYIFIESQKWEYSGLDGPGPGFFPRWYGIAMVALSLALIVQKIVGNRSGDGIDWHNAGRALSTWAAFTLSVALMDWLGFLVSFALLTFFIVAVVFRRSLLAAGATAICAALGFYVVFPLALSVSLPTGLLGF